MKTYTADFETTTIETCSEETWVWAWGTRELYKKDSFQWDLDIDSFMSFCASGGIKSSKMFYFHNLKFDGHFILDWLLRNGVKWVDGKTRKEEPNTFKTLITKEGLFYSIEWIHDRHKKAVKKSIFRDSHKKLPFSVDRIARSFKLPILKGEIDYNKIRPKGYQPTMQEIDYLENDVEIMAQALEIQLEEGQKGMTIGSDSLNTFKEIIGEKSFKRLFPVLDEELNTFIRKSYKGGFTYLNPKYKGKIIEGGKVYDVNSLYPAMMLKPMPWGLPLKFEGKYQKNSKYPLYVQKVLVEIELKDDYIPTIQIKGDPRFKSTEYITSTKGEPVELVLTSVDLELMFEHYHVVLYEYMGGYMFKQVEGIFKDYIAKYMKIKEVSEGAIRELAKLLLNNLYGKFATSTDATGKVPVLDPETDTLDLIEGDPETKESIYTAVGSYITSYARQTTITACQKNYDRFIYADTDSCHLEGYEPPIGIDIHKSHLGMWKHEGDFIRGKFVRAKTYIEALCIDDKGKETTKENQLATKIKVTCAGMPDKLKKTVNFNNFYEGSVFEGKLRPYIIKGGVVLVETDFTIKT